MKELEPISHQNISLQIYDQLYKSITSGEMQVGTKLPTESELAELFNVSRAPVREALQQLRAVGLITSRQGRGTFVIGYTPKDVVKTMLSITDVNKKQLRELLEFRYILEPFCARKAAENFNTEFNKQLGRNLMLQDRFMEDQEAKNYILETDVPFHRAIVGAVNNSILLNMFDTVSSLIKDQIVSFLSCRKDYNAILDEHWDIYSAIASGDCDKAEEAMKEHIKYLFSLIEE